MNFPPSLAVLNHVDKLIVKQKKEALEILTGFETHNKYVIMNEQGQQLFYAVEDTNSLAMHFLNKDRPFKIRILDLYGQTVIYLKAKVDFLGQNAKIQIPEGVDVGSITKEFAFMKPSFFLKNSQGQPMFKASSPMSAALGSSLGMSADFNIKSVMVPQKPVVGVITKNTGTLFKTLFTDASTFAISFPMDMDAMCKAMLLALLFHIDFAFYEH